MVSSTRSSLPLSFSISDQKEQFNFLDPCLDQAYNFFYNTLNTP